MAAESKAIRNLVVAGILLVLFLVVGVAFRFLILPMLQGDLVAATSTESRYDHEITLHADSFSGYAALRSPALHEELKDRGIKLDVVDDGADYSARMKALNKGRADLAVFTIDALVKAGADYDDNPATILAVIDETYGADAIVAYKDAVPHLNALDDRSARVVLTPDSPSEFLTRVAIAEFGLQDLSTKWVAADGAEDVRKRMKKAKRNALQAYVLWEPDRSIALENGDAHVLFDSSRVSGYIVDVLVARRAFVVEHPDVAKAVVEAMLREHYRASKDPNGWVELVQADAKATGAPLNKAQAQSVVDGIRWRNTLENYAHFGLVDETPGILHLEDSIANITDVLVRTGSLKADPLNGQPNQIFYAEILDQLKVNDFHPGKGLGITDGGLGTAQLDKARAAVDLPALTDAQWDQLSEAGSLQVKPIVFGRGNARLNVQSKRDLTDLSRRMRSLPNYYLRVVGHARAEGDPAANLALAEQRAQAAADELVSNGLSRKRVRAEAAAPTGTDGGMQSVTFVLAQKPY